MLLLSALLCLAPQTTTGPQNPLPEARKLLAEGDVEGALAAYSRAAMLPRYAAPGALGAARCAARLERADLAFRYLRRAVGNGWGSRDVLATDPDLVRLKDDERYARVLPELLEGEDAFAEEGVRVLRTWKGEGAGDQYGWVTRRVGDLDGDGVCDFASTAPTANGARGRTYVISSRTGEELFRTEGAQPGARLGNSVSGEVDVNADGVDDVITGAPGSPALGGRVRVLSGKDGSVLHDLGEETPGDSFGIKVSGIEDLDGDGHAEICIGASGVGAGKVVVVSGKSGEELFEIPGEAAGDQFGQSLDGSRGGGHRLLAVGAPSAGPKNTGRVYVFELTAEGAERRFVVEADETGVALGTYFVTFFGDVDGDEVPDLYASDFSNSATGPSTGRVYVHSGATGEQLYTITGHAPGEGFGTTAAVCGDANGDGAADLIIGAWQHAGVARSAGKCYLHSGKDGALLTTWSCNQAHDTLGFDAIGVGDADGDGQDDYVLSSAWAIVDHGRQGRVFLVAGPKLK